MRFIAPAFALLLVGCAAASTEIEREPAPSAPSREAAPAEEAPNTPVELFDEKPWTPWRLGEAWQPCETHWEQTPTPAHWTPYACTGGLTCILTSDAEPSGGPLAKGWAGWTGWCAPKCDPACTEVAKKCPLPCEGNRACTATTSGPLCLLNVQPESGAAIP